MHHGHGRVGTAVLQQDTPGLMDVAAAPAALGVVKGNHKIRARRGLEATGDRRPGSEQVRQGDGTEVVSERDTHQGGAGGQGGAAWHQLDVRPVSGSLNHK